MKKLLGPSIIRDAAPGTIEVIASTGDVDRQNDRINPRGIRFENYLRNPTVLWAHNYSTLPVGRTLSLRASDRDLRATIQFAPHDFAQQVYQSYRGEFLSGISIGFRPLSDPKPNEFGGYDYGETELLEISAVPIPANQEALVIARSMAGLDPGTDSAGRLWPWRDDEEIPDEVLAAAVSSLQRESRERVCIAPAAEPGMFHVDVGALRSVIEETIGEAMVEQRCRMTGRLD
jgi:HK97 family phage prohead protease